MLQMTALAAGVVWAASALPASAQSAAGAEEVLQPGIDEVDPEQPVSQSVIDLAAWVIATSDNGGLPFAVIDKGAAQLLVFGPKGKLQGLAPALVGSAIGDESAPGVGDRELKDIPLEDRTTPAGRFIAAYGPAVGGEKVLWIDYGTAISIHPLKASAASKREKRKERLASPEPDDNRITHGCVNVSPQFYSKVIRPSFKAGGVFYVLPDAMAIETAFPGFPRGNSFAQSKDPTSVSYSRTPVSESADAASQTGKKKPSAPTLKPKPRRPG